MDALGHLLQQGGGDLLVGGVLCEVDGDEELLGLGVDIADINTTLVGEQNPVALVGRWPVLAEVRVRSCSWLRGVLECLCLWAGPHRAIHIISAVPFVRGGRDVWTVGPCPVQHGVP